MFNAIFGNFLFSSKAAPVPEEESKCLATEASTQTTSTQTGFDVQIGVGSNDDNNAMTTLTNTKSTGATSQLDWVIIDPSEGHIDHLMDESQLEHKIPNMENLIEMGCENEPVDWRRPVEDSDVLLGSFFDKNEHDEPSMMSKLFRSGLGLNEHFDDQHEQHNENETNKTKKPTEDPTWLITPLPCLTSITESSHQRSMIDNYPLENLLIEHPSMSVFISATNSQQNNNSLPVATLPAAASPFRQQKQLSQSVSLPLINVSNQIEVTQLDNTCCEIKKAIDQETKEVAELKKKNKKANKKNNRKPNRKVPRRSVTFEKKSIVADCDLEPIIFTIGDDEVTCVEQPTFAVQQQVVHVKEEESLVAAEVAVVEILEVAVEQQIESANSSIQMIRKSKKSKKSKASPTQVAKLAGNKSSNNKENMQVKTLLLNETKKCVSPITHHNSNRFELSLLNKNQMKRNNKNSTFSSMRNNVNSNQRKYHKLQQPSFFVNIQQF